MNDAKTHSCSNCKQTFTSYAGLQQHRKQSHPIDYNLDCEIQASKAHNKPWSDVERMGMAKEEIKIILDPNVNKINETLAIKFRRTVDAIKGQRRTKVYRSLLKELQDVSINAVESFTPLNTDSPINLPRRPGLRSRLFKPAQISTPTTSVTPVSATVSTTSISSEPEDTGNDNERDSDHEEYVIPPSPSFLNGTQDSSTSTRVDEVRNSLLPLPSEPADDVSEDSVVEAELSAIQDNHLESELPPCEDVILWHLWHRVIESDMDHLKKDFSKYLEDRNPRPLIDDLLYNILGGIHLEPPRLNNAVVPDRKHIDAGTNNDFRTKGKRYNQRAHIDRLWQKAYNKNKSSVASYIINNSEPGTDYN